MYHNSTRKGGGNHENHVPTALNLSQITHVEMALTLQREVRAIEKDRRISIPEASISVPSTEPQASL